MPLKEIEEIGLTGMDLNLQVPLAFDSYWRQKPDVTMSLL